MSLETLRIFGLIVFNIGMGTLRTHEIHWAIWFVIAIVGNLGIIFLTKEIEKAKEEKKHGRNSSKK